MILINFHTDMSKNFENKKIVTVESLQELYAKEKLEGYRGSNSFNKQRFQFYQLVSQCRQPQPYLVYLKQLRQIKHIIHCLQNEITDLQFIVDHIKGEEAREAIVKMLDQKKQNLGNQKLKMLNLKCERPKNKEEVLEQIFLKIQRHEKKLLKEQEKFISHKAPSLCSCQKEHQCNVEKWRQFQSSY